MATCPCGNHRREKRMSKGIYYCDTCESVWGTSKYDSALSVWQARHEGHHTFHRPASERAEVTP